MARIAAYLPYLTPPRIRNLVRYKRDLRRRPVETSSFPPLVHIQASGFCNTHCQLCPVGLNIKGARRGFMHGRVYRRVIEQIAPYALRVNFGDWGEPMMHPHIFEMFAIARENRIATSMSTNLHRIRTEEQIRRLATEGPTWNINLSLHGVSQDTYSAYQPGRHFAKTIDKIRTLIRIRRELGITRPTLALVFVITKKNQHEIPEMKKLANELGVACRMYTASINARFYEHQGDIMALVDEWAQDTGWELFDNYDYVNKRRIETFYRAIREDGGVDRERLEEKQLTGRHFCDEPWRSVTVNWDGTVCLCCTDYSKHNMGDVQKTPLPEIWNGRQYQDTRSYFHRRLEQLSDGHPCVHCIPY